MAPARTWGVSKPEFKPGFNFYSPQEDAELGKESSAQINQQVPLLDDQETLSYLNALGKRLVALAPCNQPEYAWQFRIVNSAEINAFALPGGYIYVNRGVFEAAENEAQLAGVIAHESGHVVMRHGTHIASQAIVTQGGAALLTSIMGESGSLTGQLAQLGLGLGVDSLLLKNSRSAEAEADRVGTFILLEAGYEPRAMAQFFQIIARKYPQRTVQFFSDHPNPENRIAAVDAEIAEWGPKRGTKTDDPAFEQTKQHLATLPEPLERKGIRALEVNKQPPLPSANLIHYQGRMFSLDYPDNWQVEQTEGSITLFPPGGIVTGMDGEVAQAYGATISLYTPQGKSWGLVDATQELLSAMQQANPPMHVLRQSGMNLSGAPALDTLLQNDSPLEAQKETDRLVTVRQRDAVLTFIFVAPVGAMESYTPAFDKILQSVRLSQ
jgi:predicted Zn-dependent protease